MADISGKGAFLALLQRSLDRSEEREGVSIAEQLGQDVERMVATLHKRVERSHRAASGEISLKAKFNASLFEGGVRLEVKLEPKVKLPGGSVVTYTGFADEEGNILGSNPGQREFEFGVHEGGKPANVEKKGKVV
jgi:hypothetical protein